LGERLGVLAGVDALDLPHVNLDPEVLDLRDRVSSGSPSGWYATSSPAQLGRGIQAT
jgi:hypothetical protein